MRSDDSTSSGIGREGSVLHHRGPTNGTSLTDDLTAPAPPRPRSEAPALPLLASRPDAKLALTFAGQGFACLDELAAIHRESPVVREWVDAATACLADLLGRRELRWSGLYERGLDLSRWVRDEASRPDVGYLTSSTISQPLIFITQIARFVAAYGEGLGDAFDAGAIPVASGHSQGIMPALLVAESPAGVIPIPRFLEYVRVMAWQGIHMAKCFRREPATSGATPMAAVSGLPLERLDEVVCAVNARLPERARIVVALRNTRTRHVVSGTVSSLERLRSALSQGAEQQIQAKRKGLLGGAPATFTWEYLSVGAAYHSAHMLDGLSAMRATVEELGFRLDASSLTLDVISPATAERLNESPDLTDEILVSEFVRPVVWTQVVPRLASYDGVRAVLDLGPGDSAARLTRSLLRGTGVAVVDLSTTAIRAIFFREGVIPRENNAKFADFLPKLVETSDGRLTVANRYTRATGRPPVILPGMTPTTADAEIVAAAANAGFTAELAGGGQVTERVFELRMEELADRLEPGREVVFNALHLDPYLWDLHIRRGALVQRARREGLPLCGVTVSAGIPEVAEAVALLDELRDAGLWLNAFKPGTVAQVETVVQIAREAPQHTVFVHLEGGKAGGHHSFEDLDQLLLETYHRVREQPNLVLCVGGGVGTEERAVALLTGEWSEAYGLPAMPVDAVLLGTLAMACKEAKTSPQVKDALVRAAGTNEWVLRGQSKGGIASGLSQLDADIHYLDNPAARCGRLLDEVAGDPEAAERRHDEIRAALDATAKPYFGDLEAMTWLEVLERMVALMARGRGGRYEDGVWLDRTYRERMADMLRRAEARLCSEPEVESVLGGLDELDFPPAVLARLTARHPEAATRRLHPADARAFVHDICSRAGKPVNFVPVIDGNVRRFYKSDALWQAEDDRHEADQVLVIPGPEAVAGIRRADEPVADLLRRFERALTDHLVARGESPEQASDRRHTALPGVVVEQTPEGTTFRVVDGEAAGAWLLAVAARLSGPIALALAAPQVFEGKRAVANPVRRLLRPDQGACLRAVDHPDGLTRTVTYTRGDGEHVRLVREGGAVRLEVCLTGRPDEPAPAPYVVSLSSAGGALVADPDEQRDALRRFYHSSLFGAALEPVALFERARTSAVVDAPRRAAYAALTGYPAETMPPDMAFSLAWEPLFRVLSCDELADGLLHLVHLSHEVTVHAPLRAGDAVTVEARATRVEDGRTGRTIATVCELLRDAEPCATLHSTFLVRGSFARTPYSVRAKEPLRATLSLRDEAAVALFREQPFVNLDPSAPSTPCELTLDGELGEIRARGVAPRFTAVGSVRCGEATVGRVALSEQREANVHPVRALLGALAATAPPETVPTGRKSLGRADLRTPSSMDAFAEVGLDLNPIHRSTLMARLAGLDGPIVHGMWTAARLHGFLVDCLRGDASRIVDIRSDFLAPALTGEALSLEATRTAAEDGRTVIELQASVRRGDAEIPVVRARARVLAPRTAYVFPGQGIQQRGMGLESYARSAAARAVWDRADAYTRENLGFSILRVVRDNPRELVIHGTPCVHPTGVLNLTQLTQVAMAVLAAAQVAELREAGVLVPGAVVCGHSVGEYNALGAIGDVLPVEAVVDLVYRRGLVMHGLVPRDEVGASGYGMGVIRPHYARLDHEGAERLVREIRTRTGQLLQVVNYNVRGRQYSVTGRTEALAALAAELERLAPPGAKPPYVEVPGIDVPFHSEVLRGGVESFREALDRHLPPRIDPSRLEGRYIPNLVARPFSLERSFVEEVAELSGSELLAALLHTHPSAILPPEAGRMLLIELLAYQFASPVRWIETQELLMRPAEEGGLGIERIVEVGVGYQPTLANMAAYSQKLLGTSASGVEVLNIEANADVVFLRDADLIDAPGEAPPASTPSPAARPKPEAPASAPARQAADRPVSASSALRFILAMQARVRPEQVRDTETIDELFDGVSSRRNQVLMDIGAELATGSIDGAHERPIGALAREIERRARAYQAPGRYLRAAQDEALKRTVGRAGLARKDVAAWLSEQYGMGPGLTEAAMCTLALESREGESTRGGPLGKLAGATPAQRSAALELLDQAVSALAASEGLALPKVATTASGGGQVDAAAVRELADRVLGPAGVLMSGARDLAARLGHPLFGDGEGLPGESVDEGRLARLEAEHGAEYEQLVARRFDRTKHVTFASPWAFAQRDAARLYLDGANGRLGAEELEAEARRLALHGTDDRVRATARWFASRARAEGRETLALALDRIARGVERAPAAVVPTRPTLHITDDGAVRCHEVPDEGPDALGRFVASLWPTAGPALVSGEGTDVRALVERTTTAPLPLDGRTALVTGASPGSIAVEVVRHLLRGGARVVVTTSTYTRDRMLFYRRLAQRDAAPAAELHVVPFNQAALADVDALLDWLFSEVSEQAGPTVRVLKRPFAPDLLLPFAALPDLGTLGSLSARSQAALRAMLLGVERLIAGIASRYRAHGLPSRPCHVVLPLSPNHGAFGGDGAYAESKAALEVLLERWHSERDAWGRATTLCAARIGWVRGTGLMDQNDAVAPALEAETGVRTFSSAEMGLLLAALCTDEAREQALASPLRVDLTGGFTRIADLRGTVTAIRRRIEAQSTVARRKKELEHEQRRLLGDNDTAPPTIRSLPDWPRPLTSAAMHGTWPAQTAKLEDTVVIVGAAEVGPCGSSRTRFELEVGDALSPAAVLELAWMTGLLHYEDDGRGGGWIDTESGEPVAEEDIAARYEGAVRERSGIRFIEPETAGFDPDHVPVLTSVYLERDLTFPVTSEEEARSFLAADPDHTRVRRDDEAWLVTRTAGTEIRVPRAARLSRKVAGLVPRGFDFARYGVPRDMVESTDRVTLFNLVATVDAFLSAGLTPEELLRHIHPARVANTQGGGIGGMRSLRRLYLDHLLDRERQSDALQETLINVVAAYAVQSLVGSYGPMAHPVGACATAAISLEEGMDKILVGKADFVVAGGYDDIGPEGVVGFTDMNATAATPEMLAMGLDPDQMSRSNDARRRGFVEAQGGGTVLLARGDVALRLGLPVRGVLAYAGSFGDGIHKSIPAPGLGALSAALGGPSSPLGRALARHGLTADDIALVSKHDTSTGANDPNENALHHRIQEALCRTPGNPLWVVSQKTLTGHAKGGAAAFQVIGLCQVLREGVLPGNRNLECVDREMRRYGHMAFTDTPLRPGPEVPLRAGLVTSLGFGHASGLLLVLHPDAFAALVPPAEREAWQAAVASRSESERRGLAAMLLSERTLFDKRSHRRFAAPDGTLEQAAEEAALLLDPEARLDARTGLYASPRVAP